MDLEPPSQEDIAHNNPFSVSFPLRFWKFPSKSTVTPIRPSFTVQVICTVEQQISRPLSPYRHGRIQHRSKLRKRHSHSSLSSSNDAFGIVSLRPEVPGLFTPSLPSELWLQIFRYAARNDDPTKLSRLHHSASHSFLTHVPSHAYLRKRLSRYNALLKWKAALTTVCWFFHGIAQEILYEDVWIGCPRDGRKLAERLCGASDLANSVVVTVCKSDEKGKPRKNSWWRRVTGKKPPKRTSSPSPLPVGPRPSHCSSIRDPSRLNPGRLIRHLRVETPSMDKCSPHDLLLILQHCPRLIVFDDYKSIRRPVHPLVITESEVVPFGFNVDPVPRSNDPAALTPILTTDALAHAILSRPLNRLTWTNYAHDGENFERGVKLYSEVIGPLLGQVGQNLQVLDVISCSEGLGMGGREARQSWVVAGNAGAEAAGKRNRSNSRTLSTANFGLLGELELTPESVSTRRFVSLDLRGSHIPISSADGHPSLSLTLPRLSSLKVTLDNATFFVLSSWSLPALRNLSIVSADARYGSDGFRMFFEVHGAKIVQLELGHSSSEVEEFWITEHLQDSLNRASVRLDVWCPNLKEFICSADAEWNWETPDWIAPHVLLPSHAGLEFIGVRGLEKRLVGDAEEWVRRQRSGYGLREEEEDDGPYFMLLQQFGSMLREEAFPSLRTVRDMSWESHEIRQSGRPQLICHESPLLSTSSSPPIAPPPPLKRLLSSCDPQSLSSVAVERSCRHQRSASVRCAHVLQFWLAVLGQCEQQGVLLEDYRGNNVCVENLGYRRMGL